MSWSAPPTPFHKLNFDGSIRSSSAAAGFIIRDHHGQALHATAYNLGSAPILVAEVTALQKGISTALAADYINIEIERDNFVVINAVLGTWAPPWQIDNLVRDIQIQLTHFNT